MATAAPDHLSAAKEPVENCAKADAVSVPEEAGRVNTRQRTAIVVSAGGSHHEACEHPTEPMPTAVGRHVREEDWRVRAVRVANRERAVRHSVCVWCHALYVTTHIVGPTRQANELPAWTHLQSESTVKRMVARMGSFQSESTVRGTAGRRNRRCGTTYPNRP